MQLKKYIMLSYLLASLNAICFNIIDEVNAAVIEGWPYPVVISYDNDDLVFCYKNREFYRRRGVEHNFLNSNANFVGFPICIVKCAGSLAIYGQSNKIIKPQKPGVLQPQWKYKPHDHEFIFDNFSIDLRFNNYIIIDHDIASISLSVQHDDRTRQKIIFNGCAQKTAQIKTVSKLFSLNDNKVLFYNYDKKSADMRLVLRVIAAFEQSRCCVDSITIKTCLDEQFKRVSCGALLSPKAIEMLQNILIQCRATSDSCVSES